MTASRPHVEIFSDGACSGNPGVGGYGVILRSKSKTSELSGCEEKTTNNRMELMAVITGLEALKRSCSVLITTDSEYVMKGITQWMESWLRNKWKNSQKKEVMNRDLWERLLAALNPHEVQWQWIKGHSGHAENERCDLLARQAIKQCKKEMACK
ncbi:MAG: ribonuclease HI [Dissulfurispiraceae bacterium]|jgi:ribonuclease HI|nr:ribonuclease HI [Dissulfurispiraceae bacterium]